MVVGQPLLAFALTKSKIGEPTMELSIPLTNNKYYIQKE